MRPSVRLSLFLTVIVAAAFSVALLANSVSAQRGNGARETLQARANQGFPTLHAIATQADLPAPVVTAAVGTLEARATVFAPTAEALRLTATSVMTQLQGAKAEVRAEIDALLAYYSTSEAVDVTLDGNTLHMTITSTEERLNERISAAMSAAGYNTTVTVDYVNNGVVVTLGNVPLDNGQTATMVLTYTLTQSADGYQLLLTGSTLNGLTVPGTTVTAQIEQAVTAIVNAYLAGIPPLPAGLTASYTVDSVVISDNSATTQISIVVTAA